MSDLAAGRITAVKKVAPVAAKRPDLRIVAQVPDDPQPLGIGFGKHQAALLVAVNGALAAMRRDGSMNQLKEKWGRAASDSQTREFVTHSLQIK